MDLLSKDEPLIDLNSFDSPEDEEEGDGLLDQAIHIPRSQRRLHGSSSASIGSRPSRMSLSSKVHLKELPPARKDHSVDRHNSAIVSAVERTMKRYADGVLRVLEGMSGQLAQLELTSQDLEQTMTSLKVSVDDYHYTSDQSFKLLNERIMETHRAIQILRDKQDILEANEQLAKLQTSKALVEKGGARPPVDSSGTTKASLQQEGTSQVLVQQPSQLLLPSQPASHLLLPPQQPSQQPHPLPSQHPLPPQQLPEPPLPAQQLMPQPQPPSSQPQHSWAQQYPLPPQQPSQPLLSSQQLMPPPQPPLSQSRHSWAQHYEVQRVQSQQQGSTQLPYEAQPNLNQQMPLMQRILQASSVDTSIQQSLPTQQPSQPVLQPHQPSQLSLPPQQLMQQTMPQQASIQQALPTQQPHLTQQPRSMQQQTPSSHSRGSLGYYGHSDDAQSYPPRTSSFPVGRYGTEAATGKAATGNYAIPQSPVSMASSHLPVQLPSKESYQHSHGQASQLLHDPLAATRPHTPMSFPHLHPAQPHAHEHGSAYVNGIIEKVSAMGFSKEQVHNIVQRLAERNQAIDMNVVLDTLMNGGRGR